MEEWMDARIFVISILFSFPSVCLPVCVSLSINLLIYQLNINLSLSLYFFTYIHVHLLIPHRPIEFHLLDLNGVVVSRTLLLLYVFHKLRTDGRDPQKEEHLISFIICIWYSARIQPRLVDLDIHIYVRINIYIEIDISIHTYI